MDCEDKFEACIIQHCHEIDEKKQAEENKNQGRKQNHYVKDFQ